MIVPFSRVKGCQITTYEGVAGQAVDIYFKERDWAVCCLVVRFHSWLMPRSVLLPSYFAGSVNLADRTISAALAKPQLRRLASAEFEKPVSKQSSSQNSKSVTTDGFRLRSSDELLNGYAFRGRQGRLAFIDDLLINDDPWSIQYIVLRTSALASGRLVLLPSTHVERISVQKGELVASLPRFLIEEAPEYDPGMAIRPDYERELRMHYGDATTAAA